MIDHKWLTVDGEGRALQVFNIEENARIEAVTDTRVMAVVEVAPVEVRSDEFRDSQETN